jgi:formiminotetrahydrofolate cyclodeaminase
LALIDKPVRDLLDAFSSSDPTPGGGSASALAASVGASLLMMVAALPKTKQNSDEDRAALDRAAGVLTPLRAQLAEAIDADTTAYDAVVAAYRLPKGSDEEKQARKDAVQRAMRGATDVPLRVMRLASQALAQAAVVAAHGHAGASSDVGVARALLEAGFEGARLNVDINVGSISDAAYAAAVRDEVERLSGARRA